ncbi:MAG: Na-K-Cl cotransporter, partial [Candidatus Zixiibacteriota bacterium]
MQQGERKTLGAFLGVYTPTILTILGVIMYLRFGWIVGNYGLGKTILIALLANSITLITTLSFSSMATNMKVGAGGAYFIISRSLGLGVGAAVGIPLFLSQALSVTLYSFGLAESLRIVWPNVPLDWVTLVLIALATVVSAYGAKFALKTQIPLLILVGVSIAALAYGALAGNREVMLPLHDGPHNSDFWYGFALFFPAVTGVMAGLSLSGDLKEPGRAIPLGAIAATVTGLIVYLLVPWLLSEGARPEELRSDPLIWLTIAPFGVALVLPGLWGAIFSSAVGSGLGAPRTLQSILADQFSNLRMRAWLKSARGERIALVISSLIAISAVGLGNLNAVAQVVSMFFLTIYGTVNFAAGLEALSGDTS